MSDNQQNDNATHNTLMKGAPPLPHNQVTLTNWREPRFARWSFSHMRQLLPTSPMGATSPALDLNEARQMPTSPMGATSPALDMNEARQMPTSPMGATSPALDLNEARQMPTSPMRATSPALDLNEARQMPTSPMGATSSALDMNEARQNLGAMRFTGANGKDMNLDMFLRNSQTDCFAVMQNGQLIYDWFDGFGAPERPHIVFSISKSLTSLVVGVLVDRGVLDVTRTISAYVPEVAGSAYEDATLRQLLDMTVASGFVENYEDMTGVFMAYRRASAWNPVEEGHTSEGLWAFLAKMPTAPDGHIHGDIHHYCSPHTDMLGWVIERVSGASLSTLFSQLIMEPCGTRHDAYITLDNFGAPRAAGGYCMAVHDLLQIAEMTRCEGALGGQQIVPANWINDFRTYADNHAWQRQKQGEGPRLFPKGSYRAKWYRSGFDEDEYCAIGIHGQWIWVNPQRQTVIVRMASNGTAIDTETDRDLLCAVQAVARAVG